MFKTLFQTGRLVQGHLLVPVEFNTDSISTVQRFRLLQVNIIFLYLISCVSFKGCILSVLRFSFKKSPGRTQSRKTWIYAALSNLTGFEVIKVAMFLPLNCFARMKATGFLNETFTDPSEFMDGLTTTVCLV